jgi:hypothetical protein
MSPPSWLKVYQSWRNRDSIAQATVVETQFPSQLVFQFGTSITRVTPIVNFLDLRDTHITWDREQPTPN